jgi:imidazolonepropionase
MPTLWRNVHIASCDEQRNIYSPGAVLTEAGRIAWIGAEADLPAGTRPERTIELAGRWLTPGLIDCHTHLVFGGQRAAEFAQRTSGRSYSEIARGGGGILSTVRATRGASESQLIEAARPRLASLLAEGVTCIEIKSGYGLTLDAEVRMLRVGKWLGANFPVTVSTSFLGAHALPPEFAGRADEYIEVVAREWLAALARDGLVDTVDAWCEDIALVCASGCMPNNSRTLVAARWLRGTGRFPAITSSTPRRRMPQRSPARAPLR